MATFSASMRRTSGLATPFHHAIWRMRTSRESGKLVRISLTRKRYIHVCAWEGTLGSHTGGALFAAACFGVFLPFPIAVRGVYRFGRGRRKARAGAGPHGAASDSVRLIEDCLAGAFGQPNTQPCESDEDLAPAHPAHVQRQ